MAARLLPGGHSTTTSLLPGGCPPAAQRLSVCYLSVCCTATVRMLPVCYPSATSLSFCVDFVEIFPKILVNQEKFVSL